MVEKSIRLEHSTPLQEVISFLEEVIISKSELAVKQAIFEFSESENELESIFKVDSNNAIIPFMFGRVGTYKVKYGNETQIVVLTFENGEQVKLTVGAESPIETCIDNGNWYSVDYSYYYVLETRIQEW